MNLLTAEKSEKNEKSQQRSGEGTESPTACVDDKVASDQMKLHTLKRGDKGSSMGAPPAAPGQRMEHLIYNSTMPWKS